MKKLFVLLAILGALITQAEAATFYPASGGSGYNFAASTDLAGSLHFQPSVCDGTVGTTCATVLAGGATVTSTAPSLQVTIDQKSVLPLPSNAAQETGGNLANLNTTTGTTSSSACATDTSACAIQSRLQLLSQHLTTIANDVGGTLTVSPVSGTLAVGGTINLNQATQGTTNGVSVVGWGSHNVTLDSNNLPEFSNANFLAPDLSAWTAGSTSSNTIGGVYNSTAGQYSCVTGELCTAQITQHRALQVDWYSNANGELGTTTTPVAENLTMVGSNTVSATAGGLQVVQTVGQPQTGTTTNAGFGTQATLAITTTASHSYTQNTCVGGINSVTVAQNNNESVWLTRATVISASALAAPLNVYMFNANPTSSTCTNATGAFGVNTADLGKEIIAPQQVTLSAPGTQNGNSSSYAEITFNPPVIFQPAAGTATMYVMLQTQPSGSFTESSNTSDLSIHFTTVQQ